MLSNEVRGLRPWLRLLPSLDRKPLDSEEAGCSLKQRALAWASARGQFQFKLCREMLLLFFIKNRNGAVILSGFETV